MPCLYFYSWRYNLQKKKQTTIQERVENFAYYNLLLL